MSRQGPAPRQGANLPRPLSRSISPLMLDIRDEGPAFSRRVPRASAPERPATASRAAPSPAAADRAPQSLLTLALCAAVIALACLLYLDNQRIQTLEAELRKLTEQPTRLSR